MLHYFAPVQHLVSMAAVAGGPLSAHLVELAAWIHKALARLFARVSATQRIRRPFTVILSRATSPTFARCFERVRITASSRILSRESAVHGSRRLFFRAICTRDSREAAAVPTSKRQLRARDVPRRLAIRTTSGRSRSYLKTTAQAHAHEALETISGRSADARTRNIVSSNAPLARKCPRGNGCLSLVALLGSISTRLFRWGLPNAELPSPRPRRKSRSRRSTVYFS